MRQITLNSRAALQCARRAHNEFDARYSDLPLIEVEPPPWAVRGIEFETMVMTRIIDLLGEHCVDVRNLDFPAAEGATRAAMVEGTPIILGGAISDGPQGYRRGRPDLLLRTQISADGQTRYVPADIKSHRLVSGSKTRTVEVTPFDQLGASQLPTVPSELGLMSTHRQGDLMQLAHYWRILESLRHAATGTPRGGLIGKDTFEVENSFVLWQDLTEPFARTFSRSQGIAERSALERYDHEFDFRVKVAKVALMQQQSDAPDPLVRPIYIDECNSCPWHDICLEELGESDPSVHVVTGRLSIREWNALRDLGVLSAEQFTGLHVDDDRLIGYWRELDIPESRARKRLQSAIDRAQMSLAGENLRLKDGPFSPVPKADVEVDFDLEWDDEDRVYLWGMLVTRDGESSLRSAYSWAPMSDAEESQLAQRAMSQLINWQREAVSRGQSFRVYHYSHPEISKVRAMITRGMSGLPTLEWWNNFTQEFFVDLLPLVKERFIGRMGLGLKVVAQEAGFSWEEAEPSGAQTLEWVRQARSDVDDADRDAARERLIAYNRDDVRATLAVRTWLERM